MTFFSISPSPRNLKGAAIAVFLFLVLSLVYFLHGDNLSSSAPVLPGPAPAAGDAPRIQENPADGLMMYDMAQYFIDYPLGPPYKTVFGELGRRTRILRDWIVQLETSQTEPNAADFELVEQVAESLFPFLKNSPRNPTSTTPLSDLRASFEPGSAGIVIPTGDRTFRYAAHLIASLRSVLHSVLPITVVYAGEDDLSPLNRYLLATATNGSGPPLEFLDINTVFDDSMLRFTDSPTGGWAVKAFAALGSRWEKVVVLDADAVFLQPPDMLLQQPSFEKTGAFFFHDRLLWQHRFPERHEWWRDQIRRPSATLNKSRVWTEDYADECDSGVVVLDKGRIDVLMGLLHTCWQNSWEVRENITYHITYGDKETWWMGPELTGSPYEMGRHYAGIVGWEEEGPDGTPKVCSFVIAHVDETDKLLWYNGSLLRNKLTNGTEYLTPTKWILDGDWQKGESAIDISCMVNGILRDLSEDEVSVIERSIERAKWADKMFNV